MNRIYNIDTTFWIYKSTYDIIDHIKNYNKGLKTEEDLDSVYSDNLNKQKIDLWHNDALPILDKILAVTEAIENAHDSITSAIDDLQFDSRNSEIFHEINFAGEIDIDRAFKHIDNQSDYIFAAIVKSVFGLEYISHAQEVTP